jgi:hypothetical protein
LCPVAWFRKIEKRRVKTLVILFSLTHPFAIACGTAAPLSHSVLWLPVGLAPVSACAFAALLFCCCAAL